jgi:hypothetical protein
MGMAMDGGAPLPAEAIDPYIELFGEVLRSDPPYTFGDDDGALYRRLFDIGFSNLAYTAEMRNMQIPEDMIFIDRALGGHFGNLSRLRATGPWRDLVFRYAG